MDNVRKCRSRIATQYHWMHLRNFRMFRSFFLFLFILYEIGFYGWNGIECYLLSWLRSMRVRQSAIHYAMYAIWTHTKLRFALVLSYVCDVMCVAPCATWKMVMYHFSRCLGGSVALPWYGISICVGPISACAFNYTHNQTLWCIAKAEHNIRAWRKDLQYSRRSAKLLDNLCCVLPHGWIAHAFDTRFCCCCCRSSGKHDLHVFDGLAMTNANGVAHKYCADTIHRI